jgi:hypothetical protein
MPWQMESDILTKQNGGCKVSRSSLRVLKERDNQCAARFLVFGSRVVQQLALCTFKSLINSQNFTHVSVLGSFFFVCLWMRTKAAPTSAQLQRLVFTQAFPFLNATCLTEQVLRL